MFTRLEAGLSGIPGRPFGPRFHFSPSRTTSAPRPFHAQGRGNPSYPERCRPALKEMCASPPKGSGCRADHPVASTAASVERQIPCGGSKNHRNHARQTPTRPAANREGSRPASPTAAFACVPLLTELSARGPSPTGRRLAALNRCCQLYVRRAGLTAGASRVDPAYVAIYQKLEVST